MSEQLTILLVDQNTEAVHAMRRSLNGVGGLKVVGDAGFGPVALTWARTLKPDLVLVTTEEPLARPLATIQALAQGEQPWTVVALVSQFEKELFRKAVLAGARDVQQRTATPALLVQALVSARRADVARRNPTTQDASAPTGMVLSVLGNKGGIGKTTLASNLAISLAQETGASVALVDLDLPFGDIALLLDLRPERNVLAALDDAVINDPDRLQAQLVRGPEGIHVLAAPLVPDTENVMDAERITRLLNRLASLHDYVIVDTPPGVNETTAAALDTSALALLVTTPEVSSLRRTQACLGLLQRLEYPMDKVQVVLNRAASKTRVSDVEAQEVITYPIAWRVANDYEAMKGAAIGRPVMLTEPESSFAESVRAIARQLGGLPPVAKRSGWFSWWKPGGAPKLEPRTT